jgi:DNA-binding response OmpR family regulator
VRRLATLALTRERYRVMQAESLPAASEMVSMRRPNSIVLDHPHPLDAAKAIRALRGCGHLPVIALDDAPGRVRWRGRFSGVRFISRPFREEELVAAVGAVSQRAV